MCKSSRNFKRICTILTIVFMFFVQSTHAESNDVEVLRQEVQTLRDDVKAASEWRNSNTLIHMAGYADVGYSKSDASGDKGSFAVGSFSPIFHYQYRDKVMLESELEIEIGENGETEVKLEYLTIDWFVNDYLVLVAGKFLSPIGQFRQNIHPSWINKLPSAPPGFGHDGAAPVSDLGVQARGGFYIGETKATYAIYMGNGPELKAEIEADPADSTLIEAIELDGVEAEAFGVDRDGDKVIGGRFSMFPVPEFELGVSVLTGKATVTSFEAGEYTGTEPSLNAEDGRGYDVNSMDFAWKHSFMDVRGEYTKTKVASSSSSNAPEEASWETWYLQFSRQFSNNNYEAVLRVAEFDSPHGSSDREQIAIGINKLITNNFIGKLAYENNDNPNSGLDADNRWLLQLSYGF